MTKRRLSDQAAAAVQAPPRGSSPVYVSDATERNLSLKVSPAGLRSWWFVGRIHGQPQRIRLGGFPELTYDEAAMRCVRVRAAIYDGLDPRAALAYAGPRRGAGLTLGGLWTLYGEKRGRHVRAGWALDQTYFDRYCGDLAALPVSAITPDRLADWHRATADLYGAPTANRTLNTLRAVFNWAQTRRDAAGRPLLAGNPASAKAVPRFPEHDRDRYLDADELRDLFAALAAHTNPDCRHFFQLALFTAQRRASLLAMSFDDIDAANWIWNIPRADMKGKRAGHAVPLVREAQYILSVRREMVPGSWVFPARRRAAVGHIVNPNTWWRGLLATAGLEDATIHDLRRTTASWMALTNASEAIIAQLLGHKRHGVTARYARLDVSAVRAAAQLAVQTMLARAGVDVVPTDGRGGVPHGTVFHLDREENAG